MLQSAKSTRGCVQRQYPSAEQVMKVDEWSAIVSSRARDRKENRRRISTSRCFFSLPLVVPSAADFDRNRAQNIVTLPAKDERAVLRVGFLPLKRILRARSLQSILIESFAIRDQRSFRSPCFKSSPFRPHQRP